MLSRFDKVLIPGAKESIRKIQIFLADKERAMVVQSKIAKRLRAEQSRALREQGVAEIFGPGSSLKAIGQWLETTLDESEPD